MSTILIQLGGLVAAPTGVTYASTSLVVTDSAGASQTLSVNGSETPPFSVSATIATDGAGTVVATNLDSTGTAIGSPISTPFTTVAASQVPSTVTITQTA